MMIPGTIKDQPQAVFTKIPAISEPKMLPTEVWEFQIPMIKPRLKQSHSKTNWSIRKHHSQSSWPVRKQSYSQTNWSVRKHHSQLSWSVTQSDQLISQEISHSQFSWSVRKWSHSQFSLSVRKRSQTVQLISQETSHSQFHWSVTQPIKLISQETVTVRLADQSGNSPTVSSADQSVNHQM